MTSEEKKPTTVGLRANAYRLFVYFEHALLWLHLIGLGMIVLIHIFIPTKLFFLMVGAYHYLERDYWFFSDNMTDETGIYGPMLAVLKEDFFWVFQSYIPLLIPLVVIGYYLKNDKKSENIVAVVIAFCIKSVLMLLLTIVLGTIIGSIIAAVGYVVAFVFSSPEISADIGVILDFPASGILFFDVLLSCSLIAIGLEIHINDPKKWFLAIGLGSLVVMFLLNKFIPMEVRAVGEDSEITVYGTHWLEDAYVKEDFFHLQPYIVKKTQNSILEHQNFVSSLACKETTGVDCGTYTFPSITLNFTDQNMTRFKVMKGFFHERPSNVYFDGNTLQVEYRPIAKVKGAEEKQERTIAVGQFDSLPQYEQRKNTQMLVRPLSKNVHWGIQVMCIAEVDHEYSVVIQAKGKSLTFHLLKGGVLSEQLFVHEQGEEISEIIVRNETLSTSVFVNQKPIYEMKTCVPAHYAPVVVSAQSDTAIVQIEQEVFE